MTPLKPISTRLRMPVLLVAILSVGAVFGLNACGAKSIENRSPLGETFPSVTGKSLEKETVDLPEDLAGRPAILLVGYKQGAQFDIDRWLMGLIQAEVSVPIYEIPTIPGLVPTPVSKWIDDGMRSGIPEEDWGAVVTLYRGQARPVAELTGTKKGRLTRVLVLDDRGEIVWFSDRGYSARQALEVAALAESLAREAAINADR